MKIENEIKFVGVSRSGNHPVIEWICNQFKEPVVFINNCEINICPFDSKTKYYKKYGKVLPHHELTRKQLYEENKHALLYSYEGTSFGKEFDESWRTWKTKNYFQIILVRDPFNLLASILYGWRNNIREGLSKRVDTLENVKGFLKKWKVHAKEALGITNYSKGKKIVIKYNNWFSNKEYRKNISKELGQKFNDETINEVPHHAGGSSFDKEEFNNKAQEMNVLTRFKRFTNDKMYLKAIDDEELWDLSEKLFGQIPGTEVLKNE